MHYFQATTVHTQVILGIVHFEGITSSLMKREDTRKVRNYLLRNELDIL